MAKNQDKAAAAKAAPAEKPAEEKPQANAPEKTTGAEQAAAPAGGDNLNAEKDTPADKSAIPLPAAAISTETDKAQDKINTGDEDAPVCQQIVVAAKVEGFRRAGRAWSKTPVTLPVEDFTEAQINALNDEPMLDVHFIAGK